MRSGHSPSRTRTRAAADRLPVQASDEEGAPPVVDLPVVEPEEGAARLGVPPDQLLVQLPDEGCSLGRARELPLEQERRFRGSAARSAYDESAVEGQEVEAVPRLRHVRSVARGHPPERHGRVASRSNHSARRRRNGVWALRYTKSRSVSTEVQTLRLTITWSSGKTRSAVASPSSVWSRQTKPGLASARAFTGPARPRSRRCPGGRAAAAAVPRSPAPAPRRRPVASRFEHDGITRADHPAAEDGGVHPAHGTPLVVHVGEVPVGEPLGVLGARQGEQRDLRAGPGRWPGGHRSARRPRAGPRTVTFSPQSP